MNNRGNDDSEESDMANPNESDETEETDADESDDSGGKNTNGSDDTDGEDANGSDEMVNEAGTPIIQVHARIIDSAPEDEEVIPSNDDRFTGVELFTDIFEQIEQVGEKKSVDELHGEDFSITEDRETEKGESVMNAKSELPLTERTIRQSEKGTYVKHKDYLLFLYFRTFHED